jgi:hypothetical protein
MSEFPDLKDPNSKLGLRVRELKGAKASAPGYFSNPQWPYLLAKEADLSLRAATIAVNNPPIPASSIVGEWRTASGSLRIVINEDFSATCTRYKDPAFQEIREVVQSNWEKGKSQETAVLYWQKNRRWYNRITVDPGFRSFTWINQRGEKTSFHRVEPAAPATATKPEPQPGLVVPGASAPSIGSQLAGIWDCSSTSRWRGTYEFSQDGAVRLTTHGKNDTSTGKWVNHGETIVATVNGRVNFTLHLPIKNGRLTGVSFAKNLLTVTKRDTTPAAIPEADAKPGGIVLGRVNQLSQAQGGKSAMMADLEFILSKYGKPENDTAAHPDVTIYDGPSPGGGVKGTCRITYLMPRAKAEALLFRNRGIVSRKAAVAPGFPPGMIIHTYDIRFLIYNRLYLMVDQADQVVTLEFKSENTFAPAQPPLWTLIDRDFSTFDYINTENRGTRKVRILTHVQRPPGASYIVVNMAATRINETTTWYVPDPLLRQILFHIGEDKRKGG